MSSVTSVSPRTLGDVIPGGLVRSIALVFGGAIFVGLTAQVSIPLPFTPVPLTLQTFSVLLVGAALGSLRGVCSMALYLLAGVAGVPWFADQQSGWAGWLQISGGAASPGGAGSPITAVARTPGHLDVFTVGTDNHVYTTLA